MKAELGRKVSSALWRRTVSLNRDQAALDDDGPEGSES